MSYTFTTNHRQCHTTSQHVTEIVIKHFNHGINFRKHLRTCNRVLKKNTEHVINHRRTCRDVQRTCRCFQRKVYVFKENDFPNLTLRDPKSLLLG